MTLIDTGGAPQFRQQKPWQQASGQRSAGETVIVHYLHSLSIGRVDYLVLTHHDLDHIGYAKVILQKMVVKYVVVPAGMAQQT
ncbi:MBL fold metallo-hydrolase, partial [Leuconostoc lactis]